jgi:prevent-host-death family protein
MHQRRRLAVEDWTVAQAKAKLSEVIERAMAGRPQTITRHGRTAVVVVSADEWRRRTERRGTLADFLQASPLANAGLEIGRMKGRLRNAK